MTDRPILFSAPTVRATLREIKQPGTGKTQTRRIIKPVKSSLFTTMYPHYINGQLAGSTNAPVFDDLTSENVGNPLFAGVTPYCPGDRLWVREAWRVSRSHDAVKPSNLRPRIMTTLYEAGGSMGGVSKPPSEGERHVAEYVPDLVYPRSMPEWAGKRRPSMFMPRWASRMTLTVIGVKVERLQAITTADAIAEGIEDVTSEVAPRDKSLRFWRRYRDGSGLGYVDCPIGSYASLWTEINGPGSWEANPWVVAVTFRPILANIDAVEALAA